MKHIRHHLTCFILVLVLLSGCAVQPKIPVDPIIPVKTYDPEPASYVSSLSGGNLNNGSKFVELNGWIYYSVCVGVDGITFEYIDN